MNSIARKHSEKIGVSQCTVRHKKTSSLAIFFPNLYVTFVSYTFVSYKRFFVLQKESGLVLSSHTLLQSHLSTVLKNYAGI